MTTSGAEHPFAAYVRILGSGKTGTRSLDRDEAGYAFAMILRGFCPRLKEIMQLRPLLGLRSPVNTLARIIKPLAARCSLQSIFHPAYARIHREAGRLLGQAAAVVLLRPGSDLEHGRREAERLWRRRNCGMPD